MNQAATKLYESAAKSSSLRLIKSAGRPTKEFTERIGSSLCLYDNNNKRYFNFTELVPFGLRFAKHIGETFIFYSSTVVLDTAQSAYSAVLRFFRWLLNNRKKLPEPTYALEHEYEKATTAHWENALARWREDLINESQIGAVRKRNLISAIQTFFKYLTTRGVSAENTLSADSCRFKEQRTSNEMFS